jgi:hypothetical protein
MSNGSPIFSQGSRSVPHFRSVPVPCRVAPPSAGKQVGRGRQNPRPGGLRSSFARDLPFALRATAGRVVKRREDRFLRGWFGHRSTLPARSHAANRQELARWRVCRRRKERSVIRSGLRRLWGALVWNWRDAFHSFFLLETARWRGI